MTRLCATCQSFLSLHLTQAGRRNPKRGTPARYCRRTVSELDAEARKGCQLCAALWETCSAKEKLELLEKPTGAKQKSSNTGVRGTARIRTEGGYELQFTLQNLFNDEISLQRYFDVIPTEAQASQKPKTQNRSTYTGSAETLAVAAEWILDCIQNHHECKTEQNALRRLPTRLVFVGSGGLPVRVCQSEPLPSDTRYMTLSHCWGQVRFLTLTTKNIIALQRNIAFAHLPATFQDAIKFARYVGVDYLWIDSLCIIQDSKDDWEKESILMESVYSNGFCNIAAAGASDGSGGCFFNRSSDAHTRLTINTENIPRNQNSWSHVRAWITGKSLKPAENEPYCVKPGEYWFHEDNFWSREVISSDLCSRAWVIQERLLAKRVLYFCPTQILFECNRLRACETWQPESLPRNDSDEIRAILVSANLNFTRRDPKPALEAWVYLVYNYSGCELTYEKDRLIALAGLARHFQRFLKSQYLAGLWETGFVHQLCWENRNNSTRPTSYQAPSWSWASNSGGVSYRPETYSNLRSGEVTVDILDVGVGTVGGSEFSQVTSGYIKMIGYLIPVSLQHRSTDPDFHEYTGGPYLLEPYTSTFMPDIRDSFESFPGVFYCAPLVYTTPGSGYRYRDLEKSTDGLVLKPTGIMKGQYQRVGYFRGDDYQEERSKMTEDLYEAYDEVTDKYTFTII